MHQKAEKPSRDRVPAQSACPPLHLCHRGSIPGTRPALTLETQSLVCFLILRTSAHSYCLLSPDTHSGSQMQVQPPTMYHLGLGAFRNESQWHLVRRAYNHLPMLSDKSASTTSGLSLGLPLTSPPCWITDLCDLLKSAAQSGQLSASPSCTPRPDEADTNGRRTHSQILDNRP